VTEQTKFLLLSSTIKNSIAHVFSQRLKVWDEYWGLTVQNDWDISVDSRHHTVEEISGKADSYFIVRGSLFMALKKISTNSILASMLAKENKILPGEMLFPYMADEALKDLISRIFSHCLVEEDPLVLDGFDSDKFAGCFSLTRVIISKAEFSIVLFLSNVAIEKLISSSLQYDKNIKRGGLANRVASIAHKKVSINIEYASVNLTVQELSSIKVGDVVRLDKTINEPMVARNLCGDKIFTGYLGKKNDCLALALTLDKH
jgi:hypothetical protein